MSNYNWKFLRLILSWQSLSAIIINGLLIFNLAAKSAIAQKIPDCRVSLKAVQEKENFRLLALKGNKNAANRYQTLLKQHKQKLQSCRSQTWPETQALWLRLYPCDIRPGAVEQIMDRIVNKGYNQVYLEVFYDGRVLLPAADNPTVWPAVVRTVGTETFDLLALAIKKGQQRGLKVYAWMFTNNFGSTYAQKIDRQSAIARNGKNQTSLSVVEDGSQVFIDPYNTQAKADYYLMVQQVLRRRPDGILFDYVRYPRQTGIVLWRRFNRF
jgi:uncharacterized lipoprotein YddW (UPF0748 family)